MNETTSTTTSIPDILTANTYFWRPASTASGRRNNEARRNGESRASRSNKCILDAAGIEIEFSYSKLPKCYKTSSHHERKASNITADTQGTVLSKRKNTGRIYRPGRYPCQVRNALVGQGKLRVGAGDGQ
jgi:hypothetical protein